MHIMNSYLEKSKFFSLIYVYYNKLVLDDDNK